MILTSLWVDSSVVIGRSRLTIVACLATAVTGAIQRIGDWSLIGFKVRLPRVLRLGILAELVHDGGLLQMHGHKHSCLITYFVLLFEVPESAWTQHRLWHKSIFVMRAHVAVVVLSHCEVVIAREPVYDVRLAVICQDVG